MPIEGQCPELKNLSDALNKEAFGQTIQEANDAGKCISCKQDALPKCYSEEGRREFYISGMCEHCFDEMFEEDE
jgi:hypothetical protein